MTQALDIVSPTLPAAGRAAPEAVRPLPGLEGLAALTGSLAAGNEDAFREFHRRYFGRQQFVFLDEKR